MSGSKQAVAIFCVDKRNTYARAKLPEAYNSPIVGGSLGIVKDQVARQKFYGDVQQLHGVGVDIGVVIIADHYDASGNHKGCKAYGDNDSREHHLQNMREAARIIKEEPGFDEMEFQFFLQDIDADTVEDVTHELSLQETAV